MPQAVLPSNLGVLIDRRELALLRNNCHRSIVIRDLPYHFQNDQLRDLIVPLIDDGENAVELCRIKYSVKNGKTLQVGFVMLCTEEEAKQVITKLEASPRSCGRDIRVGFYSSTVPCVDDRSKEGTLKFTFDADFLEPLVTEELVRGHFDAALGEVSWICIRCHFFKQRRQDGYGFVSFRDKKIEDELKDFSVLQREKVVYHFITVKEVNDTTQIKKIFSQPERKGILRNHERIKHIDSASSRLPRDNTIVTRSSSDRQQYSLQQTSAAPAEPVQVHMPLPPPPPSYHMVSQYIPPTGYCLMAVENHSHLQHTRHPPSPLQGMMIPYSIAPLPKIHVVPHTHNPMMYNIHSQVHPQQQSHPHYLVYQQTQQFVPVSQYPAGAAPNPLSDSSSFPVNTTHLPSPASMYSSYPYDRMPSVAHMPVVPPPSFAGSNPHHQYPSQPLPLESNDTNN